MVINFSVKDDNRVPIFRDDGLITVLEINDFQAGGAQRAKWRLVNALLVWSTVDEGRGGVPNAIQRWRPIFMSKTDNAAQIEQSLDTELICRPRLATAAK